MVHEHCCEERLYKACLHHGAWVPPEDRVYAKLVATTGVDTATQSA